MKTPSQLPDAANPQPDGHGKASQPHKDLQSQPAKTKNTSFLENRTTPLQTKDMNMIKNYSQFFIELS